METDQDRDERETRSNGRSHEGNGEDHGVKRVVEQSRRVREDLEGLVSAVVEAYPQAVQLEGEGLPSTKGILGES